MVHPSVSKFLRKMKEKTPFKKSDEGGYTPPKPAHHWQRRKRMEEKMDKEKQEQVTQNKIDPWLELCTNPQNRLAVALFSFHGDPHAEELIVDQGDPLTIESIDRTEIWWQAVNLKSKQSGYIPRNYVTEETGINDVLNAWYEIDRKECEAKLDMPNLLNGTYILRPSSSMLQINYLLY